MVEREPYSDEAHGTQSRALSNSYVRITSRLDNAVSTINISNLPGVFSFFGRRFFDFLASAAGHSKLWISGLRRG